MKRIHSIEVKNSTFYKDDVKFTFSEKLNCIMGGRGTGKSTLLFFLKAALDSEAEQDRIVYSILKSNLGEGQIVLTIEDEEGKLYEIEKVFNEDPQPYLLPMREPIPIGKILPNVICDIYPASEIEEGTSPL